MIDFKSNSSLRLIFWTSREKFENLNDRKSKDSFKIPKKYWWWNYWKYRNTMNSIIIEKISEMALGLDFSFWAKSKNPRRFEILGMGIGDLMGYQTKQPLLLLLHKRATTAIHRLERLFRLPFIFDYWQKIGISSNLFKFIYSIISKIGRLKNRKFNRCRIEIILISLTNDNDRSNKNITIRLSTRFYNDWKWGQKLCWWF